ncbi:MAG: hypothetical protein N3B11_04910 [Coriobacteriia bacterium]|nr:hypothetical protein [Coriobacteriia bacterium]
MTDRMRGSVIVRRASKLAAAALLAAAFVAGASETALTQSDTPPIDLTGPVEPRNCVPCHASIGQAKRPGIIFSHAAHLTVDCSACHVATPHQDGKTVRPSMQTCFSCHGLQHGPTGLIASGTCRDCHTKDFELKPATHTKDWKRKPHADAARPNVNGCLMCHESAKDCDRCHADEAPQVPRMPSVYLRSVPVKPDEPSVLIDVDEPVTVGQCVFCHADINGIAPGRIIFTHDTHLKRAYKCASCHPRFPHQPQGTLRNTMQDCYRCHGLVHSARGEVAPEKCEACHPKEFKLVPANHTKQFLSGGHKDRARSEPTYCSMCHKSTACVKCHNGGVKMADGRTSAKVVPADHRKTQWRADHGGRYLAQEGLCAVCHDSPSCAKCHQTSMPHPANWLAAHSKRDGALGKDCKVCHKDRKTCQECHHAAVRSTELVAANCVKCHPEMDTKPATKIKNAPLAEHAVHFEVAKKKGKPYTCSECHVGFGLSEVHVTSQLSGPHDLRACYDCHGALGVDRLQIAPWPGSELCRRCHADLRI